jgi:hypothetical protein
MTVMGAGTTATVGFARIITEVAMDRFKVGPSVVVFDPIETWDDYIALPEIETAVCPECKEPAMIRADVLICTGHEPAVRWRWPGGMGLD